MEANELTGSVAASAIRFAGGLATKIYDNIEPFWNKAVYFTGDSPYQITDLASLLPDEIFWADLGGEPPEDYNDPPVAWFVVGRDAFDEEEILNCIKQSSEIPPFLPQEGFLDLVLFGYNWWIEYTHDLNKVLDSHEGLQYVKSLEHYGFEWPKTESEGSEDPSTILEGFREESPLHEASYMIQDRGRKISRSARWSTLKHVVETGEVPLRDSVEMIAGFIRLRRRRPGGEEMFWYAIQEWEHDLARLKRTYYDGKNYTFRWPTPD